MFSMASSFITLDSNVHCTFVGISEMEGFLKISSLLVRGRWQVECVQP